MARNFDADMDPFGGYETPSRSAPSRSAPSRSAPSGRNLDADMDPFGGPVSSGGFRGYSQPLESYFDSSNEDPSDPAPVMAVPSRSTEGTSGEGGDSGFFSRPSSKSNQEEDQKEEDDKYDPLGFLGTFAGYAQATYDRAVDAFKATPTDRTAAVNSVTDEYASALEKAAYESGMLVKEQRKAGFSSIPQKYMLNAAPEVTTTSLDVPPDVLNVSTPDPRDPMSGLRESYLDMTSGMAVSGNGSVAAIGTADEPPTVDTGVPAPAASGAGLMSRRFDSKPRKTNQYELLLYSDNDRDRLKGVQGFLTQRNYPVRGGVDGLDGTGTRAAIRHFQRTNDLLVTGQADDATIGALQAAELSQPFQFSPATKGLYTNYVTDGIEGAGHHLGGADYKAVGITLEAGIVPDTGLQYKHNGEVITLPDDPSQRWGVLSQAGVTRLNFDTANVITDNVVKEGIRRADFASDEAFSKAVITGFADKAEDKWVEEGFSRDDFDTDARKTLTDLAWNAGTDTLGYNSMAPVLQELAKPIEERDTTVMQGLLNTAPTQSGRILGGVMKRRAIQYNWSVPAEERVERVTSSSRSGTGTYYFGEGPSYTISRANGADNQDERVPDLQVEAN